MARKRRELNPFSLSFLDVMSCGFGAAVLLFLIIKHNVEAHAPAHPTTPDQTAEVTQLEKEVTEGRQGLAELRNTIADTDEELVTAEGLARRIMEQVREARGRNDSLDASSAEEELEALRARIRQLETRRNELQAQADQAGENTRKFSGEGSRTYLTGLSVSGDRILILLDASASMLDKTIVNIIRRRNMSDEVKRSAAKWQQAVRTVDWLTAQLPPSGHYQIYLFNTEVRPATAGTLGKWLAVSELDQLNGAVQALHGIAPDGGTSLARAFASARALQPQPDNIYLITDGLPTQGMSAPLLASTVSGKKRLGLFDDALRELPANTPINTILEPMEGDPMAAFMFWGLAVQTHGSFLSPAEDWP